jgi:outer membrane biosynthesis protein TonB
MAQDESTKPTADTQESLMAAKKPLIPSDAELEIANRVWSGLSGIDSDTASAAPAKVTAAIDYLNGVALIGESIRTEQPKRMEPYAEDLIGLVIEATDLDPEQATAFVGKFFSSPLLARMLADVASGNLDPVGATAKKAAKKAAPKPAETEAAAPTEPAAAPADPVTETKPAPAKKATAKKAAAKAAPAPAPAAVEPAPEAPAAPAPAAAAAAAAAAAPAADNEFLDEPIPVDEPVVAEGDEFDSIVASNFDDNEFVDSPQAGSLSAGLAAGAVVPVAPVVDDPDDF